jgi:2-dehydro-3-deoxyphosphogluconate aldolase/(4S)-4-hydroxy-2-oxoglutarate aldolase
MNVGNRDTENEILISLFYQVVNPLHRRRKLLIGSINMSKKTVIDAIETHKVFAIVRGLHPTKIQATMEALYKGGIRLVEVTFDRQHGDADTLVALKILQNEFSGKLIYGAGTVTNIEQVAQVKALGGQFIVSPNCNADVIVATNNAAMVSLPAALTPTEALLAHNAGADFVKLFPGGVFGPGYLKAVAAPLSDIKFVAVGGIDANNIPDFYQAGAIGFGIGSNLVNNKLVEANDFESIYQQACQYKQVINSL